MDKSEINLEISTGFFRISTDNVVYNITVIDSPQSTASTVVQQIIQEEQPVPPPALDAAAIDERLDKAQEIADLGQDDYYKQVSDNIFHDIGNLAKSLSSTIMDIPAEDRKLRRADLDEAGEKIEDAKQQLQDIVSMTEEATMQIMDQVEKVQGQTDDVRGLLSMLKEHNAFQAEQLEEHEETICMASGKFDALQEQIVTAGELIAEMQSGSGAEVAEEEAVPEEETADEASEEAPAEEEVEDLTQAAAVEKQVRYLFDIDTVFQTIYELCTNETVKTHITAAREQAAEIFDMDTFFSQMSEKASVLEADEDNFLTMPLSDVLQSLFAACSDKKIQNLLKKMDMNQSEIFLDQSLPLEMPETEEIEVAVEQPVQESEPEPESEPEEEEQEQAEPEVAPAASGGDSQQLAELAAVVENSVTLATELGEELVKQQPAAPAGMSMMSADDQRDVFIKIETAFEVAANICDDVTKITEALSFQDLSGQQILKIIKLLSDFQVQLLAIVVSFGSQLKNKERDASITAEESKRLAQGDVDKYLGSMATEKVGDEGALDQGAVNILLEDLGF